MKSIKDYILEGVFDIDTNIKKDFSYSNLGYELKGWDAPSTKDYTGFRDFVERYVNFGSLVPDGKVLKKEVEYLGKWKPFFKQSHDVKVMCMDCEQLYYILWYILSHQPMPAGRNWEMNYDVSDFIFKYADKRGIDKVQCTITLGPRDSVLMILFHIRATKAENGTDVYSYITFNKKVVDEGLFDDDLVSTSAVPVKELKEIFHTPYLIRYLYQYWDIGEDPFRGLGCESKYSKYLPWIDWVFDEINKQNKGKQSIFWFDDYYADQESDASLASAYLTDLNDAANEINRHAEIKERSHWKMTHFKNNLPMRSNVTHLIDNFAIKPNHNLAGGIFVCYDNDVSEPEIYIIGVPKGVNKDILKIFGID